MTTTTMSSKGQIVLPRSVRAANDWGPGTEFTVELLADGVLLKPVKPAALFPPTRIESVFGMAKFTGPAKSLADMAAAVETEARKRR
jgi:AbrB family looped-hinge helix DNA binding protein